MTTSFLFFCCSKNRFTTIGSIRRIAGSSNRWVYRISFADYVLQQLKEKKEFCRKTLFQGEDLVEMILSTHTHSKQTNRYMRGEWARVSSQLLECDAKGPSPQLLMMYYLKSRSKHLPTSSTQSCKNRENAYCRASADATCRSQLSAI